MLLMLTMDGSIAGSNKFNEKLMFGNLLYQITACL